jgi:hypothetical protein
MENSNCENCKLRAKYDAKPKSLLGRFWKWHIGFCPGWKSYLESLDEEKRNEVLLKYARN